MAGWLSLGSVVSDPWPDYADSEFWGQLLPSAARHDHKLYVKLIGLPEQSCCLAHASACAWSWLIRRR